MNPDCHYGDHDFERNGRCRHCDAFNGGWLAWQAHEKAERLGLTHGDHFHRTPEAKAACRQDTGRARMNKVAWLPGFLLVLPFVAYWVIRALMEGNE